jgi:hypothetical protein
MLAFLKNHSARGLERVERRVMGGLKERRG